MGDANAPSLPAAAVRSRRVFLLGLALGISVLFFFVIRVFVLTVLLAAVFAGLAHPLYRWLDARMGRRLAAAATLVILVAGVGLPVAGFLTLVTTEAVQVSQGAEAWFEQEGRTAQFRALAERVPLVRHLLPEGGEVMAQLREAAGKTGSILMGALAAATRGTLSFLLQLFVLLYALYCFLVDGPHILRAILRNIPLAPGQKDELLERFLSVTRATVRGSLLIGLLQGGLAGLGFWAAGVPGPAFWGTVMVVLSILPVIGAVLVWVPAVLYLLLVGKVAVGIALMLWCAMVVGTVDNFLRPRLIGRDARMSDLLVLLSTLGGIVLFGAVGFIVGPIVAALFVSVWHMYGEAFEDWLVDAEREDGEREDGKREDGKREASADRPPLPADSAGSP